MEKNKAKEKKWILKSTPTAELDAAAGKISEALGINPIVAKLLYNRGYTDVASAKSFLYMETEVVSDPYLFADIMPAAKRIEMALKSSEKITIWGDYDVDGVTSVCTLYLYLKSHGADVDFYIPNRNGEGYGVSKDGVERLAESGTKLIITVDTGITADVEVEHAKRLGVDFVITDHHECRQTLPEACAVVNPHRPDCRSVFKELAGVGVVFKLLCVTEALLSGDAISAVTVKILREYSDLIAIGTIADVMQIKAENRLIVSYGLSMIDRSCRVGIAALIDASMSQGDANKKKRRPKITSGYIGYTLAPRINAAGRIKSAAIAVNLFLAEDYEQAYAVAEELCLANKERQNEENRIMQDAYRLIEERGYDKLPFILLEADDWHHGVIGIVSSRITEKYSKPSILVSFEGNDKNNPTGSDVGKGSGRSIKGLNLVDALCQSSELLVKFGGHELAAGLSVTRANIDALRLALCEYALNTLSEEDLCPSISCDLAINPRDITLDLAEQLRMLEPHGVGNPVPVFVMNNVALTELSAVSEGKHTRIAVAHGRNIVSGMFFGVSPDSLGLAVSDMVDVLFNIDINEWNGRKNVQLLVRDMRISRSSLPYDELCRTRFSEIWAGSRYSAEENVLPQRSDFALVYRYLIAEGRLGNAVKSTDDMLLAIKKNSDCDRIGYIKLKIIIKIMQEMNLMDIEQLGDELYRFTEYRCPVKVDLEKSHLLRKLRSQQNS